MYSSRASCRGSRHRCWADEPEQARGAADINGDGKREIVASTEDGYCLAFSHDGKLLWSADVEGRANGSPTFLDLDGDGKFEVIIGSTAHVLKALRGDGATIWRFKDRGSFYHTVAADLDGDGLVEVFGTGPGGNWCLRTEMRCKPYEVFWAMQRGDARRFSGALKRGAGVGGLADTGTGWGMGGSADF